MAVPRPTLTSSLLMATIICLLTTRAAVGSERDTRPSKQMHLMMPQYYPANTQFYHPHISSNGKSYASAHAVPVADLVVVGSHDNGFVYGYPPLSFGNGGIANWGNVHAAGEDDDGMKLWRSSQREATINLKPSNTQCLLDNIAADGLGPCKVATQAEQGSINIVFPTAGQTAIIGIVANSQRHTRIKLTCSEMSFINVFTQTGEITGTEDTPRTEVGYMQVVVHATGIAQIVRSHAPTVGKLKCNWVSYNHYTAMYP
ncbi:hypothetical protein GHT06_011214 [Daphnia sinensis]|uniref:Uncharacterized protein n=1 Tax=Daphnia sinensis TaxID=1820382 RepID=A0AAD5LKI6_9CRUS|nr:hypothetical protein GHT06_011214 [Daphnia sinensis]